MCNCGGSQRKYNQHNQVPAEIPKVQLNTNQQLIKNLENTQDIQQDIQKQMIYRRKYQTPAH